MTAQGFRELLEGLADGWRQRDYARVVSAFAEDVIYVDPLRYHLDGRRALQAFYEDDGDLPQRTAWHMVLFDEARQVGVGEYTYEGTHRYHGVAIVRIGADGLITHWREYQHIDERSWEEFIAGAGFDARKGAS